MRIIKAADRLGETRGVKALIVGLTGVGKTSLLRTLKSETVLFIDIEAGDLAVQDLNVDTLRPRTWPECRDIAVLLAGANPSVPADTVYSRAHYNAVVHEVGEAWPLDKYTTYFIDSLTAAGRLCFAWASQQPEAFSERSGKRDLRGAYGLHAREMCAWLMQLQQARPVNVVFFGVLETAIDEFNNRECRLQIEGSRTGRELPAIIDQVITYQFINFGDGKLARAFVCTSPNPWNYPAKDRSGRLQQTEQPHLGKLFDKLSAKPSGEFVDLTEPQKLISEGEHKNANKV
jgi:hypothetical protein